MLLLIFLHCMFHRYKLKQGNFRIEIPKDMPCGSYPLIPKELVEAKAYVLWENKGKPRSSPQQAKVGICLLV